MEITVKLSVIPDDEQPEPNEIRVSDARKHVCPYAIVGEVFTVNARLPDNME